MTRESNETHTPTDAVAMAPVPEDHPLMVAWNAHKQTADYANSKKWAAHPKHLEGSLWALFMAGWLASEAERAALVEALRELVAFGDEVIKQFGGCDHDVGICCCADIRRIEAGRAAIAKVSP